MVDFPQGPLSPLDQQRAIRANTTARVTEALAAATAPKQQDLVTKSFDKQQMLGSGAADVIAAAVKNGNTPATSDQFVQDALVMSPFDLEAKYGAGAAQNQRNLMGARQRSENLDTLAAGQSEASLLGDLTNSAVQGLVSLGSGLTGLAVSPFNPTDATKIVEEGNEVNRSLQAYQSPALNQARQEEAIASELEAADNKALQEQETWTKGPVIAGFNRVGRDAGAAIDRALNSQPLANDLVGNAVGSLVGVGPTAKVLTAARVPEALVVPAAIGIQEGGGSYSQTVQDVLNTPFETLAKGSDLYNERIAAGDTPDDARRYVANRAGQISAPLQAAAAAATGTVVSKFEHNVVKPNKLLDAAENIGRELIEEIPQTASGDLISNITQKNVSDSSKDTLEGVGEDVGKTVPGVLGSTTLVQAPGVVMQTARDAARGALNTGKGFVNARVDNINKRNEALNPVSADKVEAFTQDLEERAPAVINTAREQIPADDQQGQAYANSLQAALELNQRDQAELPADVQTVAGTSRTKAMVAMANRVGDSNLSQLEQVESAMWVLDNLAKNASVYDQQLPAALGSLEEDHPARAEISQLVDDIQYAANHPAIRKLLGQVEDLEQPPVPLSEVNPQVAKTTADMATFNPKGVDESTANAVLYQADRGQIDLDPAQRAILENSVSLLQSAKKFAETLDELDATPKGKSPEEVAQQILGESQDEAFPSMNDHLGQIAQAIRAGDGRAARAAAQRLAKFAKHMNSKVDALNRSFDEKGAKKEYGTNKATIYYESPRLAKQIYAEAKAVTQVANSVAKNMPEFGIHEISVVSLRPRIRGINAPTYTQTPSSEFEGTRAPTTEVKQEAPVSPPVAQETVVKKEPIVEEVQVSEEAPAKRTEEVPTVAKKEEATEGVGTESEPEARTVETAFPDLVQDKKGSNFHRAFRLKEEGNTLAGDKNPFKTIQEALYNRASLVLQRGENAPDLKYAYDAKLGAKYQEYLTYGRSIFKALNVQAKDYFSKEVTRKGDTKKRSRQELFSEGDTLLDTVQGRALNLLNVVDGQVAGYNQELIQKAILAALHWNLNADKQGFPMTAEDIKKELKVSDEAVDTAVISFMNSGVSLTDAKRSLATLITQFWGVVPNPNTQMGFTQGIPEGIAAELLEAMEKAGLISLVRMDIDPETKPIRVMFDQRSPETQELIKAMDKAPQAIADAILPVNPDDPHIGTPPTSIPDTQMRNPRTKNTAQQRKVIERAQNIPFFLNTEILDFLNTIGENDLITLLGGQPEVPATLNKNHKKSVEGINTGIKNSFRNLMRQVAQIENHPDVKSGDVPLDQMPQYYEHNVSRVGRLHMLGSANPQADKIARELFVATVAQLDLRNPEHKEAFFLTLAQALGVKTELTNPASAVAEVQAKLNGELKLALDHIHEFRNGSKIDPEFLKKQLGDITMKAIHALIQYDKYLEDPQASDFTHSLSLEADGKTDGPINAIMNFTAGPFTPEWVRNMARGGLFIGRTGVTLGDHYGDKSDPQNSKDLYQRATDLLVARLKDLRASVANTDVAPINDSLLHVMNALLGDVSFDSDTGILTLKRGIAKNPLTITVYGSGMDGIAGKVTAQLVDKIYEAMSEIGTGNKTRLGDVFGVKDSEQFSKDLNELLSKSVVVKDNGDMEVLTFGSSKRDLIASEFTFTKGELLALKNNVKALFVRPLDASIREMMGPSMATTQRVQTAIQVMSLIAKELFDKEVAARLEAKGEAKKNFLSQKELNQIWADVTPWLPAVATETQEFLVGGAERSDLGTRNFSKALSDQLATPAFVQGVAEAGVGGTPYMVIGTGDGQTIQNMFANTDIDNVLAVFDGVELPATKIKEYSELINKAVWDAWQMNPVADVAAAFKAFVRRNPMALEVSQETREKLDRALEGSDMPSLAQALQQDADSITARKEALADASVPLSVDHMASASAPFSKGDSNTLVEGYDTFDAVAGTLNKIVSGKVVKDVVEVVDTNAVDFGELGVVDEFNNRILSVKDIPNVGGLDPSHAEMIRFAAKQIPDDWKVVTGDPVSLASFELQDRGSVSSTSYEFGKTDFASKVIYIANPSGETLAHELLHAATFGKLVSSLKGENFGEESAEAIRRIEGLMGEFISTVYNAEASTAQTARAMADAQINDSLNKMRIAEKANDKEAAVLHRATAINEFMAWVLTNRNLATVASKTKVLNPLFKIAKEALTAIRNFIFGGAGPKVADDIFSNLRFNTRILLSERIEESSVTGTLYQNPHFSGNARITELRDKFLQKVASTLKGYEADKAFVDSAEATAFQLQALQLTKRFQNAGWNMSVEEQSTFQMLVAALGVTENINNTALAGIDSVYAHVMSVLKFEDLMDDPASNDPNDIYMAQERFNSLHGLKGLFKDPKGRSTLMPSFLALVMVNDRLRKVLSTIEMPSREKSQEKSAVDQFLTDKGNDLMDNFTTWISGAKGKDALSLLDSLTDSLTAQQYADKFTLMNQLGEKYSAFESYLAENLQSISTSADKVLVKRIAKTTNTYALGALAISRMFLGIVNEEVAESVSEGITSFLNRQQGFTTFREFLTEMTGRIKSNAPIWDMITKVRTTVQQTRQQFREQLPAKIIGKFSRELSEQEWKHLYKGMAKTDLPVLVEALGLEKTLEVLGSPAAVAQEIQKLKVRLRTIDAVHEQLLLRKVEELSVFMNTGYAAANQLRNAYAIANLFGEGGRKTAATQELINVIDQLVTLTAIDKLDLDIKNTLSSLAQKEQAGMEFALAYLTGQRKDEQARVTNDVARANHYKGWAPLENENGHQLTIIDDNEGTKLLPVGFTRVADYKGSRADGTGIKRGYYYAPVSGRATYNQGILQTVRSTASGVDPVTGQTVHVLNGGFIRNAVAVSRITGRLRSNGGFEALLPVYDGNGQVAGYERAAHPEQLERLNPNYHLAKMIGSWRGRQVEEAMSRTFNSELISSLAHIWSENQVRNAEEFVDLFDSTDPVVKDAVKMISPEVRREIEQAFGGKEFWVRKDMLNDAVGFRQASVGDAWNGVTRWNPKVVEEFKKLATVFMGNNAYKILVRSEGVAQNVVASAKELIVVKSIIVPAGNLMSNMWQMAHRGVPIKDIIRGMGTKTVELNAYIKNRARQIEVEAELRAAQVRKDIRAERKLQTEWDQLQDANKRLSIWDLIEAGEFTAISEAGPTQEDLQIVDGKYIDMIEKLADKVPGPAQTLVRYAMVTKDTALFKALSRATQYGDFLAKAIMYDDLRKKKISKQEAVASVSEEFVNYNRLSGRTRNYLESIGLMWFWNYKIRIMKIAIRTIQKNPLRAILMGLAPAPELLGGDLGSPLSDNIVAKAVDGTLGYSLGPWMGLNAPSLNPWWNLMR